jgi:hypothetical protein
MWADDVEFRFRKAPAASAAIIAARDRQHAKGEKNTAISPARAIRIVPVGTIGKAISLRVQSLPVQAGEVVNKLRRLAFLTPSCGGPAPTAKRSV